MALSDQTSLAPDLDARVRVAYGRRYDHFTGLGGRWALRRLAETASQPLSSLHAADSAGGHFPFAEVAADLSAAWTRADGIETMIAIPALNANGFDVALHVAGASVHADFGGLSESFASPEEAMTWVRRAVAEAYELTTTFRGNKAVLHRMAPRYGDGQELVSGTVSLWPSFGAKRETVRCNAGAAFS
jgi:hypothetical protein